MNYYFTIFQNCFIVCGDNRDYKYQVIIKEFDELKMPCEKTAIFITAKG